MTLGSAGNLIPEAGLRLLPLLGTSARVTGEAEEKKRLRFAPSPRVIPNAWFQLLSEDVRFPSRVEEEQLRNKLQGLTVEDVEPGRGRLEAPTETRAENEVANEIEYETENGTEFGDKNLASVTRWKRVTCVKNRWWAMAGKGKRAVLVKTV